MKVMLTRGLGVLCFVIEGTGTERLAELFVDFVVGQEWRRT
jgi:hypothetical protein